MARKQTTFQRIRENARALLDGNALKPQDRPSRLRRFVHFWVLVWRSFSRNRCPARAAALTYTTLLALIPMLAVVVSITSTFLKKEGEERIDQFIVNLVASVAPPATLSTNVAGANPPGNLAAGKGELSRSDRSQAGGQERPPPDNSLLQDTNQSALPAVSETEDAVKTRRYIVHTIHEFIQNTRSGALGVTGSVLLIFAAISMLSSIEITFNDIWGVDRGRSWFMRIVLYWGVLILAPLLVIVALGLATGPHLDATRKLLDSMPFLGTIFFQLLPVVVLCLTFGLLYMLMPNTKVQWRAALVGGVAAGVLFHLNNAVSVLYVSRVVSNSRIYGSLGLVPVFMVGLYFCWWILLFGAQIAYAFENRAAYLEQKQVESIDQRGREFIALRLMTWVGCRFAAGEPAPTILEISEELGVPTRLIQQITQTLQAARLLVEAAGDESAYVPARPLEAITCHDVLLALRASPGQELAVPEDATRSEVFGDFQRIEEAERAVASSVTLLALVQRLDRKALPNPN